jgi:hypothetical protein
MFFIIKRAQLASLCIERIYPLMSNTQNVGTAIARIIALTGGAVAGALLANWFDKKLSDRLNERLDHDKERYAQGLTPLSQDKIRSTPSQPRIIKIEHSPEAENLWEGL